MAVFDDPEEFKGEPWDFSTTHDYSTSGHASGASGTHTLESFTASLEFEAFTALLRRAAQVLTLADFMRLRRHFDAAWYTILNEL